MNSEDQEEGRIGCNLLKVEKEGMHSIEVFMLKLYRIWDEFGLEDEQQEQRARSVWSHVEKLLEEISEEENAFCEDVKKRVLNFTREIEELSNVLQVTPVEIKGSLIKKEEMLRRELDSLTKLKSKRIKNYQDLKNTELKYCQILNFSEHKFSSNTGVPTENDLRELEQHISMLKEEKDNRYAKFCRLKSDLTTILEETALEPETVIEREIVYSRENISLSNETFKVLEEMILKAQKIKSELETRKKTLMAEVSVLWERLKIDESERAKFLSNHTDCKITTLHSIEEELKRCEKLKKENLKKFIDALKEELEQLWSKSCISDSQKPEELQLYSSSEPTDEVLEVYEAEVEKWKSYLHSVGHILDKIHKRQRLFDLLLNFDQKARDPNRFKNRKGNLLKEERERNKLQKDLPALETDIFQDIEEYERENALPFLYCGEDFRVLVTRQWSERIQQKENIKLERHKQHLLQLQSDGPAGTPTKRSLKTTPKTAPSKLFKTGTAGPQFRTPAPSSSKKTPSTVGKLATKCKLFSSQKKDPKPNLKDKKQSVLQEKSNTTTYTAFADELNSTKRCKLRSSVLATRKPGGTRISHGSKRKSVKSSRKLGNASNVASKFTPARGKYGLPFLI